MSNKKLHSINNELKTYINESTGISLKCRKSLINLIEKNFYVTLPHENYLNIDIKILENGNIEMREEEYETSEKIKDSSELFKRYDLFKEEVEILLTKNEINFEAKKKNSEISNLLIILLYLILSIFLISYGIKRLLYGDLLGVFLLVIVIGNYVIPRTSTRLKNRIIRAKKYIIKKFTKK